MGLNNLQQRQDVFWATFSVGNILYKDKDIIDDDLMIISSRDVPWAANIHLCQNIDFISGHIFFKTVDKFLAGTKCRTHLFIYPNGLVEQKNDWL